MKQIDVRTTKRTEMVDITREVQAAVSESGVAEGLCFVFVPHTTAGVTINENADPAVQRDMGMEIDKIVPRDDGYHHGEGNSDSHLKSTLYSPSLTVIVSGNRLVLGTWQGIYFCEFDGPRRRKCIIKVIKG